MLRLLPLLCLCTFLAASSVSAQSFYYPGFVGTTDMTYNGSATPNATTLSLDVTQGASQAGSAYHDQLLPVGSGFDTSFNFRVSPGIGGGTIADGFAFILHTDPAADTYLGVNGGQMGYGPNLMNGLVVEFDSYVNGGIGDTSNNEISVHVNAGVVDNNEALSIGRVTPTVNVNDGILHTARILYTRGSPGTLDIFVDNLTVPVLSIPWSFETGGTYVNGLTAAPPALSSFSMYAGFSGGCGAFSQLTEIIDWSWMSTPPNPTSFESGVSDGAGGTADILTINGSSGGFFRTVDVDLFSPVSIDLAQPPTNPGASPMALFGIIGVPDASTAYSTPYGDLAFPPPFVLPAPWIFTITDSLVTSPALLPPSFTPFNLTIPSLDTAAQITFQAGVLENSANPLSVAITNAVVLNLKALDPPVISTVSPVFPNPGDTVTVTGSSFHPAMLLAVDGVLQAVNIVDANTATFVAGGPYGCDIALDVANPDLQVDQFLINPSPNIVGFPITTGPAAGGGLFVISGSNLGPAATVDFDGVPASITTNGSNVVSGTTPPGTSGQVATVTITNPAGCTATATYTYQ